MELFKNHERLMQLIGLLRDGGLDDAQTTELESILESAPEAAAYYIESMELIATLNRQQGLVTSNQSAGDDSAVMISPIPTEGRSWSSLANWSAVIFASVAIGILTGRLLLPENEKPAPNKIASAIANDLEDSEIATLSSASGCVWDSQDSSPYEGQRLTAESLNLVTGVAVVHFDCDVSLVLEGPARLDLTSVDRAMLHHGKVVFSGEGDLDRFTLETPFSKFEDVGTEYAVSVEPSGEIGEVHVFDGRVICKPTRQKQTDGPEKRIRLGAGEARRFDGPDSVETIKLASSGFIRKPVAQPSLANSTLAVESFGYDINKLAGQNGGTGWKSSWSQPSRYDLNQGAQVSNESLHWPGEIAEPGDGCLSIKGNTGLHRKLHQPIDMGQDAAYYISFLIRKQPTPKTKSSSNWAYFTIRAPQDKTGSISIGPISPKGSPRVAHDGRTSNSPNALRDDVVYLFVCKISARKDKEDQVLLRVYGDHETVDSVEPSAWNITTRPSRNDAVLSELRLYSQNDVSIQMDDIRFGKTWSSVTQPFAN